MVVMLLQALINVLIVAINIQTKVENRCPLVLILIKSRIVSMVGI